MEERTTTLRRRIAALLGSAVPVSAGVIDDVLMTGYAHALELDAERLRLERGITASAPRVRNGAVAVRVEADGVRLAVVTAQLDALRAELQALRKRRS
jgi:hypothetical protein